MSIVNSFGSGGGGGAVSSVTNGADERIALFGSSDSLVGNTGLTYTGSEFAVTGDISSTGNYYGSQFFYHTGDTDTSMKFTVDQINLTAGNINMLKIKEAVQDEVVWFEDGNDVDFRIEVPGQAYFFWIDSGNDKRYIGGNTANKMTSEMMNFQDGNIGIGRNSADNVGSEVTFAKSRHATDGSHTIVQSGDTLGEINFKGSDGDSLSFAAQIKGMVDYSAPGDGDMPGRLIFSTTQDGADGLTEALRINQGQGVVLKNGSICVQSYNSGVQIGEGTNAWGGICLDYLPTAYNSKDGGRLVIRGDDSNNDRGTFVISQGKNNNTSVIETVQIDENGNFKTIGGSVGAISDSRVKENVSTLESVIGKVKQLNPVQFDWAAPIQNTDPARTSNHDFGFIAQEIEQIYPDIIYTGEVTNDDMPDNIKTMTYTSLIPVLTKAIQEQQVKIERKSGLGDKRLKKYIRPLETSWDLVASLNPVKFQWRSVYKSADNNRTNNFGFLADEVAEHIPELVYTEQPTDSELPENLEHIAYAEMVPILCKVIQELQARVIALEGG